MQTHALGLETPFDGDANITRESDEWPTCSRCGQGLEWQDCDQCDDGWIEEEDDDGFWYDSGDVEQCPLCLGRGGWWVCTNPACNEVVISL